MISDETENLDADMDAPDDAPEPPAAETTAPPVELEEQAPSTSSSASNSAFLGVPIEVMISVGKARPLVSELVKLRRDSVIGLDTKIDDPVEVYIGDKLIARGELEEMEDGEGQLAVRLTEVADISGGG